MQIQGHLTKSSCSSSLSLLAACVGFTAFLTVPGGALANPSAAVPASAIQVAQVPATVLYVNSASGTDAPTAGTTAAAPLKTISAALQRAQAGTVIQLSPGTYSADTGEVFPLVLKPGVSLSGNDGNKGQGILISGGGAFVSPSFARQNITILTASDSIVRGITITNPLSRGTGVWIESNNATILNNTFTRSLREGIFVTGSANPKIQGNLFTKNDGNGISVARSASGVIQGNVMQDTGFGIAVGGTATTVIAENQITQNQDGLYINDSAKPILRQNSIVGNKRDGVVVVTNAQPNLGTSDNPGNNTIRNNGQFDLNNATASNTIVAVGNDIDSKKISGKVEFVASTQGTFSDVAGNWAQEFIVALVKQGVIAGFPDGTFRPNDPVTRAQATAIFTKAFNPAPRREGIQFSDVPTRHWAYNVVQTAYRGGFVAGYPDGTFKPELPVPRVQVLVALANGFQYPPAETTLLAQKYQDAGSIPQYAVNPVAAATQRKIVVNYPTVTQLSPNRNATRAEVAAFIYQALVNAGKLPEVASPYIVTP
jgi:parallel beta-helix repeat protein